MRRLHKLLILILPMLLLGACDRPLPTYRYELTVEVETPQGLRSGSSVIEVRTHAKPGFTPEASGVTTNVRGEAVAVDLPNGQTLFALLDQAEFIAPYTLQPGQLMATGSAGERRAKIRALKAIRRKTVVPRWRPPNPPEDGPQGLYPTFVYFPDIDSPKSMEVVDPENLSAEIGTGYRLRRLTLSITDMPGTKGIEGRLKWLNSLQEYIPTRLIDLRK